MAKKRGKKGGKPQRPRQKALEVATGANQPKAEDADEAVGTCYRPVEVDRHIDVEGSAADSRQSKRTKFGPRAIDPRLIVTPHDGEMSVALALIESMQAALTKARTTLSEFGQYAGDRNVGDGLLTEVAVCLGVESYGSDDESRERGQPMIIPWGQVLAVRGLLGHFSPGLKDQADWPEPVVATRGLTCADVMLGPLPAEFGYRRSIALIDWARKAIASPPAVVGVDDAAAEEEFHKPYRITVLAAARFHLARLIAWVESRMVAFLDLVVPVLTLIRDDVEVRVAGVVQTRTLGPTLRPFLDALLDKGRARAEAKTKFDLLAKVPELRPFISVATKRDAAGMIVYRLADIVRRKAGAM